MTFQFHKKVGGKEYFLKRADTEGQQENLSEHNLFMEKRLRVFCGTQTWDSFSPAGNEGLVVSRLGE